MHNKYKVNNNIIRGNHSKTCIPLNNKSCQMIFKQDHLSKLVPLFKQGLSFSSNQVFLFIKFLLYSNNNQILINRYSSKNNNSKLYFNSSKLKHYNRLLKNNYSHNKTFCTKLILIKM